MVETNHVNLVDFPDLGGRELIGRHYGLVLTSEEKGTCLVAPLTSKKSGRKYRGGFTIDCHKYQANPKYDKAFISLRQLKELDTRKVLGKARYCLDTEDILKLAKSLHKLLPALREDVLSDKH